LVVQDERRSQDALVIAQVSSYVRRHHVALLALFLALGGTSYAAVRLPKNSVGSRQLKTGAVTSSKVRDHSLRAADFRRGQLPAGARGTKGDTGAAGAQGPKGDTGASGAPGAPGYHFTTGSGATGPTLSQAGTYFVVVKAFLTAGGTRLTGDCVAVAGADIDTYDAAFNVPPSSSRNVTFSGMLVVPSGQAPAVTSVDCTDSSGNPLAPSPIKWWVSPVG
jgi:hypothetical protein